MGVSKNWGTPKWMVYIGKPYFLMDDLGVPLFLETPMLKSRDLTFTAVSSKFDGIEQTLLFGNSKGFS